jgi:hypothetical protein
MFCHQDLSSAHARQRCTLIVTLWCVCIQVAEVKNQTKVGGDVISIEAIISIALNVGNLPGIDAQNHLTW